MKTFIEKITFKNSLSNIPFLLSFLLPFLIIFSRAVADITIIFVSILFLCNSYLEKDWVWVKSKWFLFALFFWLYCLFIVTPFSINVEKSFLYSFYFIRWPLFAMALYFWIFKDSVNLKNFLKVISLVFLFLCLDSWWQYFNVFDFFGYQIFEGRRLTGPFDRPLIGIWLTKIFLFVIFYFYIKDDLIKVKLSYFKILVTFILFFLTVFISGERMALLLTIFLILILLSGLYFQQLISIKQIIYTIAFIFFSIFLIYIYDPASVNRSVLTTIEKIINWRTSDYGRIWESAYMVWLKSPIIGSGFHTYREVCNALIINGVHDNAISGGVCSHHPHNISLELLSELGIVGFILFYLIVFFIGYELNNAYKEKKYYLLTIYFAILISCFLPISSGMSVFSNKLASLIWLLIGTALAFNNKNHKIKK